MVELLKQGQYQPMDVIDQVMSIYAGNQGHLDDVPRTEVAAWEKGFLTFMREQKPEIRKKIAETKDLDDADHASDQPGDQGIQRTVRHAKDGEASASRRS